MENVKIADFLKYRTEGDRKLENQKALISHCFERAHSEELTEITENGLFRLAVDISEKELKEILPDCSENIVESIKMNKKTLEEWINAENYGVASNASIKANYSNDPGFYIIITAKLDK